MNAIGNTDFVDEFFRGCRDCHEGVEHQPGQSEAYDRGYSHQYQYDQVKTHQSEVGHG